jgi:DNA helicase-2/ATP-dependent DNA helicase PcrA
MDSNNFAQVYAKLNTAQKEAVGSIYGPMFVLAGPGTGKTQLLSARAANVLSLTDAGPENILCLTYTEAGATAMRQRMADIIGPEAYKINVMTFHGFALDVASTFSDYFLDTLGFQPIDELSAYLLIEDILPKLKPDNKLKYRTFQTEGRVKDLLGKISYLKDAGLSPEATLSLVQKMRVDLIELNVIAEAWPSSFDFRKGPKLQKFVEDMATLSLKFSAEPESVIVPLKNLIISDLAEALSLAAEEDSTKALTAWKSNYLEKNAAGEFIFKENRYLKNLEDVAEIYGLYQKALEKEMKLEFSDMILNLNLALEKHPDLSLNLAEKYQFIMVDEFQDTNLAQLGIIESIASASESPNIMAVGDDDQAIYAFQGARVSNIKQFIEMFDDTKLILLEENYRSGQSILSAAEQISSLIESRPSGNDPKKLINKADLKEPDSVTLSLSQSSDAEVSELVEKIKAEVEAGRDPQEIAVLATKHDHLEQISAKLINAGLPVYYEKSNNLLESPVIEDLLNLSRLVLSLNQGDFHTSRGLITDVINAPYWGFETDAIWRLSLEASKQKKHWLELISEGLLGEKGSEFYKFIMDLSHQAASSSLEQILDLLVGANGSHPELVSGSNLMDTSEESEDKVTKSELISPFKNYYFSEEVLRARPAAYANFLAELSSLREHLRNFWPDRSAPKLKDLVTYTDIALNHGGIKLKTSGLHISEAGINLMTAYGSKGLEFESVYIVHANDKVWGGSARGKTDTLRFTSNLLTHSDGKDDKTRLFYVALTRAKLKANISLHKFDLKGAELLASEYALILKNLQNQNIKFNDKSDLEFSPEDAAENYTDTLFGTSIDKAKTSDLKSVLKPALENFKLSATSLNDWLGDESEGKIDFIQHNLLRFPKARNASAVQGSAVHKSLELAQLKLNKTGKMPPLSELQESYQEEIAQSELDTKLKSTLQESGSYSLEKFYDQLAEVLEPGAKPEASIKTNFDRASISGKLDLLKFNDKDQTVTVIDFKTGRPNADKTKAYKSQLYFYRLLLEMRPDVLKLNGKQYKLESGQLIYISPREDDLVIQTTNYFDGKEEAAYLKFKEQILEVWDAIQELVGSNLLLR